jgi:hypothetical protein
MPATSTTPATTLPSTGIGIPAQIFHSDANWPMELILNVGKANWQEWDCCLRLITDQHGFGPYLNGTLVCPDASTHPKDNYGWRISNLALCTFILKHVSYHHYETASVHQDSHSMYNTLQKLHMNQGPYAKIKAFKSGLSSRFIPNSPLTHTFDDISKLHTWYIKMGKLDDN